MRVLGIESSTSRSGVAVVDEAGLVVERAFEHEQGLLINLAPAIEQLLREGVAQGVEGIAVSTGPGSFTGLRIGVATAKALAYGWKVPMAAVPTMDALAWTVWERAGVRDGILALVIRSRRGEVFGAVYDVSDDGPMADEPTSCLPIEGFLSRVKDLGSRRITVAGDAVALYRDTISACLPRAELAAGEANFPSPAQVAMIGRSRLLRGETVDPMCIAPDYYRRTYVGTQ